MIRFMNLNTAFLALTLLVAYGTYHIKYEAQRAERELQSIEGKIAKEKEREQVLRADWSLLNEPARLQTLANRHLALKPVDAKQIVAVKDLPARVPLLTAAADGVGAPGQFKPGLVTPARLQSRSAAIVLSR